MLKEYALKSFFVLSLLCLMLLIGCAKPPPHTPDLLSDDYEKESEVYDPIEPINRLVFSFNDCLYNWVFFPVADTYVAVVPDFIQTGVRNLFHNFSFPVRMVGDIFQLNDEKLKKDSFFFVINTVFSFGLIDFRSETDIARDEEDISQSLAIWGISPGPYIVWPFFGPSNIRNAVGMVGNLALTPYTYLGYPDSTIIGLTEKTTETGRNNPYKDIVKGAVDPYSAIMHAYNDNFQKRLDE